MQHARDLLKKYDEVMKLDSSDSGCILLNKHHAKNV
jgi:hypothetical protein